MNDKIMGYLDFCFEHNLVYNEPELFQELFSEFIAETLGISLDKAKLLIPEYITLYLNSNN